MLMASNLPIVGQSKPIIMKKILVLFTTVIASAVIVHAQTFSFGFKAGANANNLPLKTESGDVDDIVLDGGTTGFHVGGVADIAFSSNFSVQPNLLFVMKGGGLFTQGKTQLFTIDLPINALYRHNGFFIGAGPNLSYGVSAKLKPYEAGEDDIDLYEEQPGETEPPFNRFEVGVNAVMGYQFPSGLTLGANFTRGFSNVLNDEDGFIGTNTRINTRFVGFSIGYMFAKKAPKKK
jgi:hypothetical protein